MKEEPCCSICLSYNNSEKRILPCNHIFHRNCINEWLIMKKSCPICRTEINEQINTGGVTESLYVTVSRSNVIFVKYSNVITICHVAYYAISLIISVLFYEEPFIWTMYMYYVMQFLLLYKAYYSIDRRYYICSKILGVLGTILSLIYSCTNSDLGFYLIPFQFVHFESIVMICCFIIDAI